MSIAYLNIVCFIQPKTAIYRDSLSIPDVKEPNYRMSKVMHNNSQKMTFLISIKNEICSFFVDTTSY